MKFDTATHADWIIPVIPESLEPIALHSEQVHFFCFGTKLDVSHKEHVKWEFANVVSWLIASFMIVVS
jgi:hypothetical protein